ncbi:autotransporter domain-containing protein [Herbaspirillum sp. RTI4]|uniref:autotransporter family protein n=1 Tax=Herbaspirillum sp. RTI4 TaxID=3048640 RepID=UPI002AB55356|nr:autotransporter domain-containing protein [Herbaspirillum sp. RTI4]MDY7578802.1 autotransporter domain-containing protein [Herbaspirillum sp. RTI4]MEA9983429.1 autotransporter domain-containing protein [Herbaspirillum sp. RTI4]
MSQTGPINISSGDFALPSDGVITGASVGINTSGAIGTLSNSGAINGTGIGISSASGTIDTLNNGGVISGGNGGGIVTKGGIGTLINSGTISGGQSGIRLNAGAIGMLDNSGTAIGNSYGIWLNFGTIGTLNNSGTLGNTGIGAPVTGIIMNGTIGTLSNSGNIGGPTGIRLSSGTIGVLNNSGTISGDTTGIWNLGTIGTLNNSGLINSAGLALNLSPAANQGVITNSGTIAGGITNASTNDLTINGGTGSVFGTLTGFGGTIGTITNTASNVVFGSGNQLLNSHINVGINTVTNVGTGTLQVDNPISITGNYSQGANATLNLGGAGAVTLGGASDAGEGRLIVSGSATIAANSTVALTKLNSYGFAQGQRFIAVEAANSGTNYNANNLVYKANGFNGTVKGTTVLDGGNLYLLLTLVGASNPSNSNSSLPSTVAPTPDAEAALTGLFDYNGVNPNMLNLLDAVAAAGSSAAANHDGAQLGPAANTGASREGSNVSTQAVLNVLTAHLDSLNLGLGRTGLATGESGANLAMWGQAFGGVSNQGQRDSVSGYRANYGGVLIGADTEVSDQWRAGGLVSYANTSVNDSGDNAGSSTRVASYGLVAYARYTNNPWYVDLEAGAVRQQYSTSRSISFPGFAGTAEGDFNGLQYITAVQTGYPIKLGEGLFNATVTPIAGLTYSTLHQNGYTETGGNGAALSVSAADNTSLKSELGAKLERSFATDYGDLVPSVQLSWRHEYHNTPLQSVANFSADSLGTTTFTTRGASPIMNTAVLSLGLTLLRSETLTLSAKYAVEAASGYTAQTASLRLRYQF